jgi:hypothetical protein
MENERSLPHSQKPELVITLSHVKTVRKLSDYLFYFSLILSSCQCRFTFLWAIVADFLIKIQYVFIILPVCDICPAQFSVIYCIVTIRNTDEERM